MLSRPLKSTWSIVLGMFSTICSALMPSAAFADEAVQSNFRLPEAPTKSGLWEITLYAGDDLAHDIYSMTLDSHGRVVVAGRGYVKILHDDDGDGRADRATRFSKIPRDGAHGLYFHGSDLICVGDKALMRLKDRNGDLTADGPPEILTKLPRTGGHMANGVIRGPDGWYYIACGNDAGVSEQHATTQASPVLKPDQGAMVRVSPDGRQSEIVADGFRNPYDLDFNAHGTLFTVDADGERDQYMPWYSPTRLFDVAAGMHHGWVLPGWVRSWNRPPWFFDNVERLVEIGRGSPTGVTVYRHGMFPHRYRGGVFSCCWSVGRIYHFPLKRAKATYSSRKEIFLEATGDFGFAPVDIAVGPEGEMYVAIGGRGTRGSVFRIRYVGNRTENQRRKKSVTLPAALRKVLDAPQPLASWSRARWVPLAKKLGPKPFEYTATVAKWPATVEQRIRAVEILVELFDGVDAETAEGIIDIGEPALTARLAWALSRKPQGEAGDRLLARLTSFEHPVIERAAWEAIRTLTKRTRAILTAEWSDLFQRKHRRVRAAAILAAARLKPEFYKVVRPAGTSPAAQIAALWCDAYRREPEAEDFRAAGNVFARTGDSEIRLEAVRLMQKCLGDVRIKKTVPDVYAGYAANDLDRVPARLRQPVARNLAAVFPTGFAPLDREVARLWGMMHAQDRRIPPALAGQWAAETRVEDDIHYLIVLSRIPGERTTRVTQRTAKALVRLHGKMQRGNKIPSRFWPQRIRSTFKQLCRRDPNLPEAMLQDPLFGRPEHALFAALLPKPLKVKAVRTIVRNIQKQESRDLWTAELVELLDVLPESESRPLLRDVWKNFALRDTVVLLLARDPQPVDRAKFLDTLKTGRPQAVEAAANALSRLRRKATVKEILAALRSLRHFDDDKRYADIAGSLNKLLQHWTGIKTPPAKHTDTSNQKSRRQPRLHRRWFAWFRDHYPQHADELIGTADDVKQWTARLATIDWSAGDATRGEQVFARRNCLSCHGGASRLGPSLDGIASRFSREDLLLAVVDPDREVSPAYRVVQIVTESGKVYHGQVIYESPEATLLQTGPETTVRISGAEIAMMRKSPKSPMPNGLLREATDRDIADLYAYLKTLRKR